jgi:hypothetical protein
MQMYTKKIQVFVFLACQVVASQLWAATYYVDNTLSSASDNNSGTQQAPWQHCPGLSGWTGNATLRAGDIVRFNSAGTWKGSGGNALLEAAGGVTYDGSTWGGGTRATLQAAGSFARAIVSIRDDDPVIATVVKGFNINGNGTSNSGLNVNWPSSVTLTGATKRIENCDIHDLRPIKGGAARYGIKVGATTAGNTRNVEIIGTKMHDVSTTGIAIYAAVNCPTCLIENVTIRGCVVGPNIDLYDAWNGTGILLKNNQNNTLIENTEIYDAVSNNLIIQDDGSGAPKKLIVRYNLIHDGPKHGITVQTPNTTSFDLYGNVIYGNGKNGIEFSTTTNGSSNLVKIFNNTLYQNTGGEISFSSSNATYSVLEIKNNILYSVSGQTPLRSAKGNIITGHSNNLLYRPGGGTLASVGGTSYSSANITGFENTAIAKDPLFVNVAEDVFALTAGSSAIGKGINPGFPLLNSASSWPDNIILTSQTSSSGFDIGAYAYGGLSVRTLAGLTINGPSSIDESSSATFTATAAWSDGSTSTVTPLWNENSAYATISVGGVMTTLAVTADQNVTVSAGYTSGGITKTASKLVSIADVPLPSPPPPAEIPPGAVAAELGPVTAPMQVVLSAGAPGGSYVETTSRDAGSAVFNLNIVQPGTYKIIANVYAADSDSDSFLVKMDNGPEDIWDMNPQADSALYNVWRQDAVTGRGTGTFDAPQFNPFTVQLAAGPHTLTISGREPNAKLAYAYLIESGAPIKTLSGLTINGPSSIEENSSGTYTATAAWSDGSTSTVTPLWSENSTYATISSGGVMTTLAVTADQSVTVSAGYTSGGITKTASKSVNITDVPLVKNLSGLTINGPASINESSSGTYTATAAWSDGSTSTVTPLWSENSTYATISSGGVVTALAVTADQSVTVSAGYTSGGVTKTASKSVSITDVSAPPAAGGQPSPVLLFRAEAGALSPETMAVVSSLNIPGGSYITPSASTSSSAVYDFDIDQQGTYKIVAEVFAADNASDSFLVKIDNNAIDIWDLNPEGDPALYGVWRQDEVTARGTGTFDGPQFDPLKLQLAAGHHTITVSGRELNSRLAYFYLIMVPGATGLIEAESGVLTAPMQVAASTTASGGAYIATATNDSGSAVYRFDIVQAGTYKIVANVYASGSGSDSFLVAVDNGPADIWDLNPGGDSALYNVWRQGVVTGRGTGTVDAPQFAPLTIPLAAGPHTVTFRGREANARLDAFYLMQSTTEPSIYKLEISQ